MKISNIRQMHKERRAEIRKRLEDFKSLQSKNENEIFAEMCFCILTPQSKALNCWDAIVDMKKSGLLYSGQYSEIGKVLQKMVRFHNNKAKCIVDNRNIFFSNGLKEAIIDKRDNKAVRDFLVETINGYGYKEASHFLRNIGFRNLAILDRHILKKLAALGVIEEVPKSLTKKKYLEIENKFQGFSEKIGIPMDELDLLFWSMQTGKVFK